MKVDYRNVEIYTGDVGLRTGLGVVGMTKAKVVYRDVEIFMGDVGMRTE